MHSPSAHSLIRGRQRHRVHIWMSLIAFVYGIKSRLNLSWHRQSMRCNVAASACDRRSLEF